LTPNSRSYLNHFAQPDTIVPDGPQGYDRYAYANNNPVRYTDPTGHCILCLAVAIVGGVLLGTSIYNNFLRQPSMPADANASSFGDLVRLGMEHAQHVNITGGALTSLESDHGVQVEQGKILNEIQSFPNYGKKTFSVGELAPPDPTEGIQAGDHGGMLQGIFSGDQNFWNVKAAYLYSSKSYVSADGTITTTWQLHDSFDFEPDWSGNTRQGWNYWQYNIWGTVGGWGLYNGILNGAHHMDDTATWTTTVHPKIPQ
jgi:hypothetical protein